MCGQELVLGEGGVAGPGTDEPGLAHGVVPHHHTLDGLHVGALVVHRPPGTDASGGRAEGGGEAEVSVRLW